MGYPQMSIDLQLSIDYLFQTRQGKKKIGKIDFFAENDFSFRKKLD